MFGHSLAATLRSGFNSLLFRGIYGAVGAAGCPLLVLQHPKRWRTEFPAGLRHLPLAGVVLIGHFKSVHLLQFETLGKPVVVVDRPPEAAQLSYVCVDNFAATYDATMRLVKLGRRRIAFVQSIISSLSGVDPDSKERLKGFRAACRAARLREENTRCSARSIKISRPILNS